MAGQIQFSVHTTGFELTLRSLRRIVSKDHRTANFRALRHAADKTRTKTIADLVAEKGDGKGKRRMGKKVKRYASFRDQEAKVWIGLRAGIGYGQAPEVVKAKSPGGFLATVLAGQSNFHRGWFVRKPQSRSSAGRDRNGRLRRGRLPIQEVKIPLQPEAEQIATRNARVEYRTSYPQEYRRQLRLLLRR